MNKTKSKQKGYSDLIKKGKPIRKNGGRVARVFEKALIAVSSGEDVDLKQIQREEGYSEESIRCGKVRVI